MTTDITNISDYKQIKVIIKSELESLAAGFVSLGFYLKKVRDEELFLEGGYKDIFEFAQNEYNLSKSVTSRWMGINDKFSVGGNSPEIDINYKNYGSSLLSEMLTLPEENYVLVTENTTVAQIREMKKEFEEDDNIPGQLQITNYPEYIPEKSNCDVATNLEEFVKWYYANEGKLIFEKTLKMLSKREWHEEEIMYLIAPSKFKVFRMSSQGMMANIVCNPLGISMMVTGIGKEEYTYISFLYAFDKLFGHEGEAEDIYRKYYNEELKETEKLEKPKEEPKKEVKEEPKEESEELEEEVEEETEELEEPEDIEDTEESEKQMAAVDATLYAYEEPVIEAKEVKETIEQDAPKEVEIVEAEIVELVKAKRLVQDYKRLAELVRHFDNIELLACEIESLVDGPEVESINELADFLQEELSLSNS